MIYLWSFIIYNNEACDDDTNAVIIDTNTVAIDYSMLEDLRSVEAPAYAKKSLAMPSLRNSQQTSFLSTASSTLNSQGAECCAICLEEFGKDEQLKRLECGHHFHKACLGSWLRCEGGWSDVKTLTDVKTLICYNCMHVIPFVRRSTSSDQAEKY